MPMVVRAGRRRIIIHDAWEEGKHPRAPAGGSEGGQFVSEGGAGGGEHAGSGGTSAAPAKEGGSSVTSPQQFTQFVVNSHVGSILKKHGYKKIAQAKNGDLTFQGPGGHKVVIHPSGQKTSGQWTIFKLDQEHLKGGGIQLEKHLQGLGQAPVEAPPSKEMEVKQPENQAHPVMSMKSYVNAVGHGWTAVDKNASWIKLTKGGQEMWINAAGKWTTGGKPWQPENTLNEFLTGGGETKPATSTTSQVDAIASKAGYATGKATGDVIIYNKAGSTLSINTQTGEWQVATTGYGTKKGTTPAQLEQLIVHKKVAEGVTNVPGTKMAETAAAGISTETSGEFGGGETTEASKLTGSTLIQALIPHAPKGTASQEKAIRTYTGGAYTTINNCLRHEDECGNSNVPGATAWLDQASLPHDVTVFRKVSGEYAKILRSILHEGAIFHDRGFISTSTSKGVWGGSLTFEIRAKKGDKGAAVKHISQHPNENEVIFQRNTRFRVISFDRKTNHLAVEIDTGNGFDKKEAGGSATANPSEAASASTSASVPASPKLQLGSMKKVGTQKGSNPGGVYQDTTGQQYYVKHLQSEGHAKNEKLAGKLYQAAGVNTLDYVDTDQLNAVATKMTTLQKPSANKFNGDEKKEARKHFAVHAWLANWDVAGLDHTNMAIVDGKPTVTDTGGALLYRAQGAPKGGDFKADSVPELQSLRDPQKNPQTAALFAGMTDKELKDSINEVAKISNQQIIQLVNEHGPGTLGEKEKLANTLIARKHWLIQHGATI